MAVSLKLLAPDDDARSSPRQSAGNMELCAELVNRDDTRRPFRVSCERSLPGLLRGLEQLKEAVSAELSELVLREKGDKTPGDCERGAAAEEEEEEDEDEDDDHHREEIETKHPRNGPPAKRTKTGNRNEISH